MNSYSSKRQKAQKKKRVKRKKEPTSAAQKILIFFCLAALLILVSLIVHVVSFDNELQNNDESSSLSTPTTAVATTTAVQTAVTATASTSVSSTSTETETTAVMNVTTVNSRYKYRASFSMALPDAYSGEYNIEIICNDTGKIFTVPDIVIPDMTSASQELYYLTPDNSVSADVYLINTANSKRALIGTAEFDFGNSSADLSGLDAESAFIAVQ